MASRPQEREVLIERARAAITAKQLSADEALSLAAELTAADEFGRARQVLTKARAAADSSGDPSLDVRLRQQIALCTYKDTHQNEEQRLLRAREALDEGGHLDATGDPETLGLAGAIHKRLWEIRNEKRELERSLEYYRRGHEADRAGDFRERQGYPGINAAFILDLLAHTEAGEGGPSAAAGREKIDARRDEAAGIRDEIATGLEPLVAAAEDRPTADDYWALATLAEARFGLRQFDEARRWLVAAKKVADLPSWQFRTTARQLSELARLLEFDGSENAATFATSAAGQVLLEFLGNAYAGLETAYIGKVGLAFSGGGFRASLFHIGVLARLAELDALRHIEVISCVSGGSIIGAHYYLELRKLLRDTPDAELTAADYVQLVERVQKGFLKGVQSNLRVRIAAEWLTNLRMIFSRGYSRTRRLGELYEEKIYAEIDDGEQHEPRYISGLFIVPKDKEADGRFDPRRQNWDRAHKVPILILNATTLNTGHNWQFTASWMGEPPTTVNPEIDSNYRLRRLYYDEAPPQHRKVRLGTAVGASSCVPGLFSPVVLDDLYEHPPDGSESSSISVRLVDGGVHDNQGVVGLIEQDCDVMLVSDASGQMGSEDHPSAGLLAVPLRANSILQARVRDAEYTDLKARERSRELREMMFIHLMMDLKSRPVNWKDVPPAEAVMADADLEAGDDPAGDRDTPYGMNRVVQRLLAGNRTDLDAWSDAEAFALMLSGYRMTERELARTVASLPEPKEKLARPDWAFMAVDDLQQKADPDSLFMRILAVGKDTALKVWRLYTPLKVFGIVAGIALTALLAWFAFNFSERPIVTVGGIGLFVLFLVAGAVFGKTVMRIVRFRETLAKIALGVAMAFVGFLVARLHLHVFNPLYLRLGRVANRPARRARP